MAGLKVHSAPPPPSNPSFLLSLSVLCPSDLLCSALFLPLCFPGCLEKKNPAVKLAHNEASTRCILPSTPPRSTRYVWPTNNFKPHNKNDNPWHGSVVARCSTDGSAVGHAIGSDRQLPPGRQVAAGGGGALSRSSQVELER